MTKTEETQKTIEEEKGMDEILAGAEEVEFDESDRAGGTSARGTQYFGICQRQSDKPKVAEHAGHFWTKNDEGDIEFYKELEVVILESSPRSTRFGDAGQVMCRSYDGKTDISGKPCKDCKYYCFNENEIPKEKKCRNSYIILCLPADDWTAEPFFLQITPAGIRDWKDYANDLQNLHKRPVFSVVTEVTTIERKANLGKSFVPVFTAKKALSKDDTNSLREIRIGQSVRFRPPEDTASAGDNGTAIEPERHEEELDRDPFIEE